MTEISDSFVKVYFDGGYRNRRMETCVVLIRDGRAMVRETRLANGGGSVEAEWLALTSAMSWAVSLGVEEIEAVGDALTVIEVASGMVRANTTLNQTGRQAFVDLIAEIPRVRLTYVRRDLNLAGRYLESGNGMAFRSGLSLLEGVEELEVV